MNYLIDTHILLWYISGDKRIKEETKKQLEDAHNNVFISNASLWEITIKASIGKLELKGSIRDMNEYLVNKGFKVLEFDFDDLDTLLNMPFFHQDPFDRMIIAQAKTKKIDLITYDENIPRYFLI